MLRAICLLGFAALGFGQTGRYTVEAGYAITQGDIIIGRADQDPQSFRTPSRRALQYRGADSALWPNATMYYIMDADVPVQGNLKAAIDYWNAVGPFKILPRTDQPNYVRFQKIDVDAACSSWAGMIGGEQAIGVTASCSVGSAIHELGHAWGLMHEQSRWDRNAYITVLYENADKRFAYNFDQDPDSVDTGYYDYDSIMHYGPAGFGRTFTDTIATVPPGIPIGQRAGLSAGDIDAVSRMYGIVPTATTITTAPAGLQVMVDGTVVTTPQKFDWPPGSQHTVAAVAMQGTYPRYLFARWSDGGAASHTVTASSATTVFCAAFQRQYPVTLAVGAGEGTVSMMPPAADGYVVDRQPYLVTATPASGYFFERWSGFPSLVANGLAANPVRVANLGGLAEYRAMFKKSPLHVVDSSPRGVQVIVDGGSYYTPAAFPWVAGTAHQIWAVVPQLQGNNTHRFTFRNWDDGSSGLRTVTATADGATFTANFREEFLLDTGVIGSGLVRVSPGSADGFYEAGTRVSATAVPGPGRAFGYWLGDLAGSSATQTVAMDQQRSVTAYFGTALPFLMYHAANFGLNRTPGTAGFEVAPGEIVSIFGSGIGPANGRSTQPGAEGRMPTSVDGVSVTFDGVPAPITYAGPDQINAIVPYAVAGRTTTQVAVRRPSGNLSAAAAVVEAVPGLFTYDGSGKGAVAALNQDGSINTAQNPAAPGSVVVLYAAGAGQFTKAFPDGQVVGAELVAAKAPVYVRFERLAGEVQYAGVAPYLVSGALQVNVTVPRDLVGGGAVPVRLIAGTAASPPGTTIWIR
jgi:uncharacterized protein (TIGR03437 family)